MINFGKFKLLKTKVFACDYGWVIANILGNLKKRFIVAPVASHPIVLASRNDDYQEVLDKIDFILPDSYYVKWAINFLYGVNLKQRVYGPELTEKLFKKAEENSLKVFCIGNNKKLFLKKIRENYPNLKVEEFLDLRGRKITNNLIKKINSAIKRYRFDLLFIGIGSPNQHFLAVSLKINRPIICVGVAFDFISGVKKQAPKWIGDLGFEWLFRLINEPTRLLTRYLICGTLFVVLVVLQRLKKLRSKIF